MQTKIASSKLIAGMYVADLDRPWLGTPFWLQGFLIENDEHLMQLRQYCKFVIVDSSLSTWRHCWLRKNDNGLYEMYLNGNAVERGVGFGKLGQELVQSQEQAFTDEIQRMIPSKRYLGFLKYVVIFFVIVNL